MMTRTVSSARFQLRSLAVSLGLLGWLAFGACREEQASPRPSVPEAGPAQSYSPFLLEMQGELPFREITFKQVGSLPQSMSEEVLFETLAESLALELSQNQSLPMSSNVTYSAEWATPEQHLHCAGGHIYVDVWRSAEPERWGFSLWSGCGEDSQFAWHEVVSPKHANLSLEIEPLTKEIASRIRAATERRCFRKAC